MHKLRDAPGQAEEALRAEVERLSGPGRVYVLGLGYLDKADDGAGVVVAEALKKPFPGFSFSEHDGVEGTVLDISETEGGATVFFVDAADMGAEPGSVRVVPMEEIEDREISTHRVPVKLMASILERAEPVYESLPGWKCELEGITSLGDLPDEARAYLKRLQELCHNVPILLVSVGPDRTQTIEVESI